MKSHRFNRVRNPILQHFVDQALTALGHWEVCIGYNKPCALLVLLSGYSVHKGQLFTPHCPPTSPAPIFLFHGRAVSEKPGACNSSHLCLCVTGVIFSVVQTNPKIAQALQTTTDGAPVTRQCHLENASGLGWRRRLRPLTMLETRRT